MHKTAAAAAIALAALSVTGPDACAAPRALQVGTLNCRLSPTVGLIVGSRQRMRCRFVRSRGHQTEHYLGTITRFGLDVGITAGGVMVWRVLARTRSIGRGILAGHYVGASGDISLGPGLGAKALVGGSRRTTILQPISVSGRVGVNLAIGIAGLTLRFTG